MLSAPEVKGDDFPWVWLWIWVGLGPRNPFGVHAYKTHQTKRANARKRSRKKVFLITRKTRNYDP